MNERKSKRARAREQEREGEARRNREKQAKVRRKILLNKRKCSQQSVLLYSFKVL